MTITNVPAPATDPIAATVASLEVTREQACQMVVQGLNSIKAGILHYYKLGLSVTDLYEDLKEAGWDKSKRTLQRYAAVLRNEGLLPETNQGARSDLVQTGSDNVSPPAEVVQVMQNHAPSQRMFSVVFVEGLQQREIELTQENEQLKSEVNDLKLKVDELHDLLKDNSITV